jgi:uncharacterized protein YndB with AHSA1/START domain
MTMTSAPAATQVYRIFIKATPEQIWDAITQSEFTTRYFHGGDVEFTEGRRRSHGPDGTLYNDEAVLEFDPPRRLVHGWRSLYDEDMAAEPESRVTWEITPKAPGMCLLTVIHDQLDGSPRTASSVFGEGWTYVLSGLKSLLETGEALPSA